MNKFLTRRQALTTAVVSVVALPTVGVAGSTDSETLAVAKGKVDDLTTGQSGYSITLLVLDSEYLAPVHDASIELTLIGPDGGDGGFADFVTNEMGIATVNKSLWPGRYQVNIRAPQGKQLHDAEFSKPESLLVVLKNGSYSPREFRLANE